MSDATWIIPLVVAPVIVGTTSAALRLQPARVYWTGCAACLVVAIAATPYLHFLRESRWLGSLFYLLLPILVTFGNGRRPTLRERPVLAFLLGPLWYLACLALTVGGVAGLFWAACRLDDKD